MILVLAVFSVQFSSVAQSCLTLCDPMDCSMPGFPVCHQLPELAQTYVHHVGDAIHLILCLPLLFLPSIFPSIRVFSNELALRIRWPNYWNFSFSIGSSNEYSGLFSSRIDWFDLLAVQETLKNLLQQSINSLVLSNVYTHTHTHTHTHNTHIQNTYVICLFGVRHGHVNCFGP